jgi:GT2 family glycosyltransferase
MDRFQDVCDLLHSLHLQTYPSIEVIFVADQIGELEKRVHEFLVRIGFRRFRTVLHKGDRGVSTCRNIGIEASVGDLVAVVDDDVVLHAEWAEEMVKSYTDENVVAVTGPVAPLWEDPRTMAWFPKELFFVWGCTVWDWSEKRDLRNVGGMSCSFRRASIEAASVRYDPRLGPKAGSPRSGKWLYVGAEEIDLSLRLRMLTLGRILYNPAVRAYHKVHTRYFNLTTVAKRCLHFGYTKGYVRAHFGTLTEPVLGLEYEHLRWILRHSTTRMLRDLLKAPVSTCRSFAALWLGVLCVGMGYLLYQVRPHAELGG